MKSSDKNPTQSFTDVLKIEGVNSKGYGIVPKIVMQDPRLTRDAKAIYCYFASFAGKGDTAFPSVGKICLDLGFGTEDTYRRHFKLLKEYDYIRVSQQRNAAGKFFRNIYTLVSHPDPDREDDGEMNLNQPTPKNKVTAKVIHTSNEPTPEKTGYGEKPSTDNQGNNNTKSFNKNSSFKNRSSKNNNKVAVPEQIRYINCRYNNYELSDNDLLELLKEYEISTLLEVIEYIKKNEPMTGYSNITRYIIGARNWYFNLPKQNNNYLKNTRITKFHNFEQRSSQYSAQDLEDIARRKREEHKAKKMM